MSTPTRDQVARENQWDVESVYATPELWEQDFERLPRLLEPLMALRGQLTSPEAVASVFKAQDDLGLLMNRVYLYAHMLEDVDTANGTNQARMGKVRAQFAKIGGETAWVQPEILTQPEETLRSWTNHPALAAYRRSMELLLREKPHTLSAAEETLLGLASDVLGNSYQVFAKLTNADLKFQPAQDANDKPHEVTNGTFLSLLQNQDRTLRRNAFGAIYQGYGDHQNTLATLLYGSTKAHVFNANVRHFDGALESSLFNDNIPTSVYTSLIEAVHGALPAFHEYVALRSRSLKLPDLNMWDLHVPIVPDLKLEVSWEQARQWVCDSLKPMGEDYHRTVQASFTERWYDVYENKGKRSGAYSTGAYGQKPFILMNYHASLDDVFTLAHELGHSMHTFFSNANQPYRFADYPIFLAEIASTTNEALLHHHLMETQQDPRFRAYLLNHLCDSFRGTLFRQTMFAEFELEIHRRVEQGEALTAEGLKATYRALNAKFYGPNVQPDDRIAIEWARIPHFYYNFYVYKYATGFAAAQIFAGQVLSGVEGRERYLSFLRSGSSRDPLDTVRAAGVDLTDPAVLQKAFASFRASVAELGGLLESLKA